MMRREFGRFLAALGYFTRLPVPAGAGVQDLQGAARYLPAVGLVVGVMGALAYVLAALFWPKTVAVLVSIAATLYATGAFHEDGLSDTADGLGGGWDKERILEIMKDSRVGSYGVVALILALVGKFMLLVEIREAWVPAALVAGHAVSRFGAIALMAGLDYARSDASSKTRPLAARLSPRELAIGGGFALLGLLLLPPLQALVACLFAGAAALWLAGRFRRWLGGYTGDCLGAVQQVSEIAFYLGLLAAWP